MCLEYSKTCVKWPLLKRPKLGFQDQLSLNAGQKYCRMLQGEHSAILSTFIKLPIVIKIFVLSILAAVLHRVLLYLKVALPTPYGPANEILVPIAYAQKRPLNAYADISSGPRGLKFDQILYLPLYFVYASSEGSV